MSDQWENQINEVDDELDNVSIDLEEFEKHNDKIVDEAEHGFDMTMKIAGPGDTVHIKYRTMLENGDIVDEKVDEPLIIELGNGILLKAFEEEIDGMFEDEEKEFEIKNAYGNRNEKLKEQVQKSSVPNQLQDVGHRVSFIGPDGKYHTAHVEDVNTDYVTLDFNNPLAGHDLKFWVKLIKIEKKED